MNKSLEKYLRKNPVSHELEPIISGRLFRRAIVIPAYAEAEHLPATLAGIAQNPPEMLFDTLVLTVINNPPDGEAEKINDNQKLLSYLRADSYGFQKKMNLFLIDASSKGLELSSGGGVGSARKLGMDTVLRYLDMKEKPLIFCLDADTLVSPDYIEAALKSFISDENVPGGVFSFEHQPGASDAENAAIIDYELFMRYYVAGLEFAASPYAYHALGSAMVCTAEAYIKAGGMREKNGGEDFYFLQALRKTGPLIQISGARVFPSSRPSDRVSFGTGPKIREIMGGKNIKFYNPLIFNLIKQALHLVSETGLDEFSFLFSIFEKSPICEFTAFLESCAFRDNWERICRNTPRDLKKLREAFNIWFDAFRTLKFIHFCERSAPDKYPQLEILPAFRELFEAEGIKPAEKVLSEKPLLLAWLRERKQLY